MSNLEAQAKTAVERLLKADEDQLFAQLGIRARALTADPAESGSFDPAVVFDEAEMGVLDEVGDFGRRLFRRWNHELYELACGRDTDSRKARSEISQRLGVSATAAAAYLAGLLVSSLGLSPALAAVGAAIIVKRLARPAAEEFCESWHKALKT